jgi:hypothetical protein
MGAACAASGLGRPSCQVAGPGARPGGRDSGTPGPAPVRPGGPGPAPALSRAIRWRPRAGLRAAGELGPGPLAAGSGEPPSPSPLALAAEVRLAAGEAQTESVPR